MEKQKSQWLRVSLCIVMFLLLDLVLRAATNSTSWYPIYMPAPNLFSLGFGALVVAAALQLPQRWGRVLYGGIYALCAIYGIVQYGIWRIFGRFLFLSDFMLAGEGMDFIGYVRQLIDWRFLLVVAAFVLWGVIGVRALPEHKPYRYLGCFLVAGFVVTQVAAPITYGPMPNKTDWNAWASSSYEYREFNSPAYDMALTGPYQFVLRDAWLTVAPDFEAEEKKANIDVFFAERPAHKENEMTGLLAGKNLIMIQLESVDDFVLNAQNTPTLARLQREGINFAEYYTPQYTSGYTFNTEFATQTGTYPYSNGNVAYSLGRNAFPYSIANLISDAGYTTNSFHMNSAKFYNRGAMHRAFGYEEYHSALDYAEDQMQAELDTFMVECDELYQPMIEGKPFMDFIITYTAHLGYDEADKMTTKALEQYPEYIDDSRPYEVNGLFAKARLTDDMVTRLLERLEEDGVLQDTVLCIYDDHYSYGFSDRAILEEYSEAAGGRLLERTPCFIWYDGCKPLTVNKTLQTVDLLPTLANLFGLSAPQTMGHDAFDPDYEGHVVFQGASWMNDTTYVQNGDVVWNEGMTEEQIAEMTAYVGRFHEVNDAILDTDYYADMM